MGTAGKNRYRASRLSGNTWAGVPAQSTVDQGAGLPGQLGSPDLVGTGEGQRLDSGPRGAKRVPRKGVCASARDRRLYWGRTSDRSLHVYLCCSPIPKATLLLPVAIYRAK